MRSPTRTLRIRSRCSAPCDRDAEKLAQRHQQEIDRITRLVKPGPGSLLNLDAPDAYAWSLYHLLQNEDVIKNTMFPISLLRG